MTVPTAVEADDDLPHWVPDGCHERLFPTLNDAHGAGLPREVGYRYTPDDLVLDPWVAAGDASLASLGFSEWHTGGGCWAQGLCLPTEREALFTDREGVSLPERGAGFMFGCYERDQEDRWMVEFLAPYGLYRVYWNARILGEPEAAGAFRIQYREPTVGQKAQRPPAAPPAPEPTFLAPGEVLRIQDVAGNVLTVRAAGFEEDGLLQVETSEFQHLCGRVDATGTGPGETATIDGPAFLCDSR